MINLLRDRRSQALAVAIWAAGIGLGDVSPALFATLTAFILYRFMPLDRGLMIVPVAIGAGHVMWSLLLFALEPTKVLLIGAALHAILLAWLYARPNYYSLVIIIAYEGIDVLGGAEKLWHASLGFDANKIFVLSIVLRVLVVGTAIYAVRQIKKSPSTDPAGFPPQASPGP